jgi:protein ImuB
MEIACVIGSRSRSPARPGRSGGLRPGRHVLPDPVAVAEGTEAMVRRLEKIGAGVESERAGEAFFAVDGLRGIHGNGSAGVIAAARGVLGAGALIGLGPTRLAAFLDAREARPPIPVSVLADRLDAEELVGALEQLGVGTLEALAGISADQMADRFGRLGLEALRLARGEEEPLRPRRPHEDLAEQVDLPEGTAGRQLDSALGLLIDRLLAAPQRRGRTLLGLRLGALLAAGGSWSVEQGLGRPSASARVLRTVLTPRLESLPGPATALRLRALGLGPPDADQLELAVGGEEPRRRRLGEAVREVRSAQGPEALLKVLSLDSRSRVPERWAALTPFPEL